VTEMAKIREEGEQEWERGREKTCTARAASIVVSIGLEQGSR